MTIQGKAPDSSPFMLGIMVFSLLFQLALAAWAISTIVGLFRMRSWARTSIMIMGGCRTGSGLTYALIAIVLPVLLEIILPLFEIRSEGIAHALQGAFSSVAMGFLSIAAIGVWWMVYFSLRRTREAFAQAASSGNVTDQAAA